MCNLVVVIKKRGKKVPLSSNIQPQQQNCRFLGFLTGGYVLRLFHGHMDECLAIPGADQGDDQRR